MEGQQLASAIEAWGKILGASYVTTDAPGLEAFGRNVSGMSRRIPAVLRPETTDEVRDIVEIANRYRIPLYPISCGRNWGMGSRLPVADDCAVVDLGRMNRILDVNVPGGYAVIEPGVTQWQLYNYLQHRDIPLTMNVTGSARETSPIGNSLDRGIGYFASRADELSGLEVVLGNGEVVRTGFGHYNRCETVHLYRHGIGPSLDGLLHQGNFGIVTQAGVRLMPRAPCRAALLARIQREDQLAAFVDALADLNRSGAIRHVAHIGNYRRSEAAIAPLALEILAREGRGEADLREEVRAFLDAEGFGPWSAVCGLTGTHAQVAAARRDINSALRGVASVVYLTDFRIRLLRRLTDVLAFLPAMRRKKAILPSVVEHYGLTSGIPTSEPLRGVYWSFGETAPPPGGNPNDNEACGMLYVLPILPLRGDAVREAADVTIEEFGRGGFESHITFNLLEGRAVESVINLYFDRRDAEQTARAQDAAARLEQRFIDRGWYPYRVGIQSMHRVVDASDPYWRTMGEIKKALDPNGIIAPGRYSLT